MTSGADVSRFEEDMVVRVVVYALSMRSRGDVVVFVGSADPGEEVWLDQEEGDRYDELRWQQCNAMPEE